MLRAIADTHAVIWYLFDDPRLSARAGAIIDDAAADGDQVGFSSISLVEIIYLSEKGRIDRTTFARLVALTDQLESVLAEVPVDRYVAEAMQQVGRAQVPDMPDRIIAATALAHGVPVISRDTDILHSVVPTIW
jgi:PIN domain nuclease of toxin-antitoxin system